MATMFLVVLISVSAILVALALCNAAGRESRWEERWRDAEDDGHGCMEDKSAQKDRLE